MTQPITWTLDQLSADADQSQKVFRRERMDEPLELYTRFFDQFTAIFSKLVDDLNAVTLSNDPDALLHVVKDANRRTALRYLTAPPISEDDLKVLAESRLSAATLKSDPDAARRVRGILLHVLDRHRFPWVQENRAPSQKEREIAIVSSAALVAARKVETDRRSTATKAQERAAKGLLDRLGFKEVPKRAIHLLSNAPAPGEYCGESILGDTRADLVVGLHDQRVLAIECKASNSQVNSFKRVNHEAAGKAQKWLTAFGKNATVPSAVLSGVFNVNNLVTAQAGGLFIFWSHRLEDLAEFIQASKPK